MEWISFREPVSAWTHLLWLILAMPGTWLLWRRSRGNRPKQLSLLIFGLSLIACFGGSTLYHGIHASEERVRFFEELDCTGIYLLIAGTYTPIAFNLLLGRWKWSVLLAVWVLAGCGSGLRIVYYGVPPWLYTSLYMILGWGSVLCYFEVARQLSHRTFFPVIFGGLLYTIGAVINLVRWPVLWPGAFEAHEFFHLFVMAGSLTHYCFMLQVVVPFVRAPSELQADGDAETLAGSLAPGRVAG